MTYHEARRHVVAPIGEATPAARPMGPETREGNDSTDERHPAIRFTRRRLITGAAGFAALVATGAGGFFASRDDGDHLGPPPNEAAATPELQKENLRLNHLAMPETLNAATFEEVVANLGQAIQYAVNHNNIEGLRNFIPGGAAGVLQPGQFEYRAGFIQGYRQSSAHTINDTPNDPDDPRYYPWGFRMDLIKPLNRFGENSANPDVTGFAGLAQITVGDLPPLVAQESQDFPPIETPHTFETEITLTRYKGLTKNAAYIMLPDIDGQPGHGWGLANIGKMYPVPSLMRIDGKDVPPLYK